MRDLTNAQVESEYDKACRRLGRALEDLQPYEDSPRARAAQANWEKWQTEMIRRGLDWRAP